jgi:hypothetical protein
MHDVCTAGLGEDGTGSLRSPQGHLLAHSSALMHGGHAITHGVRYILVAFVTVEPAYLQWAYSFYEHVKAEDEGSDDAE